jgi:hypothetical protein
MIQVPTTLTALAALSLDSLRACYREIRDRSGQSPAVFDDAVEALLEKRGVNDPSPAYRVRAAQIVSFPCESCGGSGKYVRGDGSIGACYRCGGRRRQRDADRVRNANYDAWRASQGAKAEPAPSEPAEPSASSEAPSGPGEYGFCKCCGANDQPADVKFQGIPMCEECFAENAHAATHASMAGDDA